MFATYGWSRSLQEMGDILQDHILISENSSIVIITNSSTLRALSPVNVWNAVYLSLKKEKYAKRA